MPHDASREFPEQYLTRELQRIGEVLQRGDLRERSLIELYELLVQYDRGDDREPQSHEVVSQLRDLEQGSQEQRLSVLMGMIQNTQTQLQRRAATLTERLEAHEATLQANASYGSAFQREYSPTASQAFRYQT